MYIESIFNQPFFSSLENIYNKLLEFYFRYKYKRLAITIQSFAFLLEWGMAAEPGWPPTAAWS
jgi:hypothetical protein